ncbi:MBL fold metallo-hydrolase [Exiguobacterium qingdaonense]|uniref:MBL fold metallo-hydrolase n=1 Tax=Exiguobacterium qingdaonense TaxID=2751251 RepID=UPI001BE8E227|nr:MBL fold metallo-hydrolase [Exiguobacterium qingdaonense]
MQLKKITSGLAQENGYVLEKDGTVVVIDPGTDDARFFEVIDRFGAPSAILLTHAHFDHIGGIDALRERYQIPVYVHRLEADWLTDGEKNGAAAFQLPLSAMKPAEKTYEGDTLEIGQITFKLHHTPGHSPGSVVLYMPDDEIAFCGDLIFKRSVGRTDLYGGDQPTLMGSIDRMKQILPDSTVLYSGHGPETTLKDEKLENPFFR